MSGSSALAPLILWVVVQTVGGWPGSLCAEETDPSGHLFFVRRMEEKRSLVLRATSPHYEVVDTNEYRKETKHLVKVGESFGFGDRFAVKSFTEKIRHDPVKKIDKDVSELLLHDNAMNKDITLIKEVAFYLRDPSVELEWHGKRKEGITAGIGDMFRIPGQDETTYKVIEVREDSAVIAAMRPDGNHAKEIVIARKPSV